MAEWIKLGEFQPSPLMAALQAIAEDNPEAADAWVAGLEIAQEVLGLLSGALGALGALHGTQDPVAAILSAFSIQLREFLQDIVSTGVGFFPILPKTPAAVLHPFTAHTAMIDAAFQAFDGLDPERPTGGTASAYAGLVVLVGANHWADFRALLAALDRVFGPGSNWGAFADLQLRIRDTHLLDRRYRAGSGAPWDWESFDLMDIPALRRAFGPVLAMLENLANAVEGLARVVQDAADLIAERIQYITDLLQSMIAILEFLKNLQLLMTEAWVLPYGSTTGGVAGAVEEWVNSNNKPDLQLVAGFILHAEGPNAAENVRRFTTVVNLQQQRVLEQYDRLQAAGAQAEENIENIQQGDGQA